MGLYATLLTFRGLTLRYEDLEHASQCIETIDQNHTGSQLQIVFLEGFPSPEWFRITGSLVGVERDPLQAQIDFICGVDFTSQLPSSRLITKLPVSTVGKYQVKREGADQVPLKELRAACEHEMRKYRKRLDASNGILDGDPIVRQFALVDETFLVVEQEISLSLFKIGQSWTVLVCCDIGKDLSSGLAGPWQSSNDYDTCSIPSAITSFQINERATDRSVCLEAQYLKGPRPVSHEYGKNLDVELMRISIFYALSELFAFSATSEIQVLNLLDSKIKGREISSAEKDDIADVQYLRSIAEMHQKYADNILSVLKRICFSDLTNPRLEKKVQQEKARAAEESLLKDFGYLQAGFAACQLRCQQEMDLMMNLATIDASRKAIEQSQSLQRLTSLAFVFLPFSFICSVFGMNATGLAIETLRHWLGGIILLLTCLFVAIMKDQPAFKKFRLGILAHSKAFMKSGANLRHLAHSILDSPERNKITWICECGVHIGVDAWEIHLNHANDLRQLVGISMPRDDYQEVRSTSLPLTQTQPPALNDSTNPKAKFPGLIPTFPPTGAQLDPHLPYPGGDTKLESQRYLELCVNVGYMKRRLCEIDLAHIKSDGELFTEVRKRYWRLRRSSFPYNLLTAPVELKYIKFQLEDCHRVWVTEESSPPFSEIKAGRYHCERPKMPAEAFFHYFHHSDATKHRSACWINHLPKKTGCSILAPSSDPFFLNATPVATAWGILIEEKLNQKKAFWFVVMPLVLLNVGVTICWSVWSGDRTEGLTAGALLATIIAVVVISLYKIFEQA